jgi:hypothetical protein
MKFFLPLSRASGERRSLLGSLRRAATRAKMRGSSTLFRPFGCGTPHSASLSGRWRRPPLRPGSRGERWDDAGVNSGLATEPDAAFPCFTSQRLECRCAVSLHLSAVACALVGDHLGRAEGRRRLRARCLCVWRISSRLHRTAGLLMSLGGGHGFVPPTQDVRAAVF